MEGLLDHSLRDALTRVGGVDRCVSEFIRITDQLLPARVFTRIVPELLTAGRTAASTPVRPQLLGSDPACLADNAALLASLGPEGIDLNFGCPAPTVNRHRGGAVLLDEPELVHAIVAAVVAAVRRAVPAGLPVLLPCAKSIRPARRLLPYRSVATLCRRLSSMNPSAVICSLSGRRNVVSAPLEVVMATRVPPRTATPTVASATTATSPRACASARRW